MNSRRWRLPRRTSRRAKAPLAVTFSGLGSTDADGDALTYAWDLDGDNLLDDSTAAQPTFNYTTPGTYTVTLKVTDTSGAFGTNTIVITVSDNTVVDPGPGTPAPKTTSPTPPRPPGQKAPVTGATGPTLIRRGREDAAPRGQAVDRGARRLCRGLHPEGHGDGVAAGRQQVAEAPGLSVKAASGKVVTLRIKLSRKKMRASAVPCAAARRSRRP